MNECDLGGQSDNQRNDNAQAATSHVVPTGPLANEDSTVGWNLQNSYARLPPDFFQLVQPTPVSNPTLVLLNVTVARTLGLDPARLTDTSAVDVFAGNRLPPNSMPLAQAYAGHQFGGFTMLGDGRAILLGEQLTPTGRLLDIQLKGGGLTAYSRQGDGRAALGPMLREYIISHAMQALGIPTTLSLAVVQTGQAVYRQQVEPGAVLTRVAASHLRVGTFQYAAALQQPRLLQNLADYAIDRHYPELTGSKEIYRRFLRSVVASQAALIARWMQVGFIHGVMNTDNMSIAGETIDYGPCAFMNAYSPHTVFSSIDHQGRYAYGNQPRIAQWNLARFAESLLPLLDQDPNTAIDKATEELEQFAMIYRQHWLEGFGNKLGLPSAGEDDVQLIESLLQWMASQQVDFTVTFRDLAELRCQGGPYDSPEFQQWLSHWRQRVVVTGQSWAKVQERMQQHNPVVIPRNHCVEEALSAAVLRQDKGPLENLLAALARPYDKLDSNVAYRSPPPGGDAGYCTFCGT
ncbi:MAG: YdiU family protein [Pirellulaceae bacterium]|nr:YdiU family protein [Pirellulaceae bacterium]